MRFFRTLWTRIEDMEPKAHEEEKNVSIGGEHAYRDYNENALVGL
jgi:hypothetical protein